jgi:hypothetical protein
MRNTPPLPELGYSDYSTLAKLTTHIDLQLPLPELGYSDYSTVL